MVFISQRKDKDKIEDNGYTKFGAGLNKVHCGLCGNVQGFQRVQSTCATAGIEKKEHAAPGKSLQSRYQLNKKYV